MPQAPRFGWRIVISAALFAVAWPTAAFAQQPDPAGHSIQRSAASEVTAFDATTDKLRLDSRAGAASGLLTSEPAAARRSVAPTAPPTPPDHDLAVPEAQTLLIVGGGLLLVALAKRRVRIAPVVR